MLNQIVCPSRLRGWLTAFLALVVMAIIIGALVPQQALATMVPPSCVTCHPGYPNIHPVDQCDQCHAPEYGANSHWNNPSPGRPGPSCYLICHSGDGHSASTIGTNCLRCHTPAWPDVPMHTDAEVAASHTNSTTWCNNCHNANIITVHDQAGLACVTCHKSSDPKVLAAVASGNTQCTACHSDLGPGHTGLHGDGFPSTDECATCHTANIAAEHDGNCNMCHNSTNPAVVAAIAAGNPECVGCHSTLHGATLTYFDFQAGNGVVTGTTFKKVFPASWNATFSINNGSQALGTATPHSGYSQSTAKCSVCHAVHRAPTLGTSAYATIDASGTATTSSRYKASAWTAEASTQMLMRTTTARACIYCHVVASPTKMYGGDSTLAIVGDTPAGWGPFYAHTTGCTSCHAVHGANTFKSADKTVDALILKAQGVKNLGTIGLVVQPEVYGGGGALYDTKAKMLTGTLSSAAASAGVTPKAAAITAQCSICHANYAVGEETINANYLNPNLFQPASWATANGATTRIVVGTTAAPVGVLPGVPGITYTTATGGSPGSLIMAYKNHPMKAGGQAFKGAGASAGFTSGNVAVSGTGSAVCQSCHNAPETVVNGGYAIQSFPHYTPGYYKFMAAQNQAAFSTPSTFAQFTGGRQAFFSNPLTNKPAIMNDGYCTKCHTAVGTGF